jgi:hypothetical protein
LPTAPVRTVTTVVTEVLAANRNDPLDIETAPAPPPGKRIWWSTAHSGFEIVLGMAAWHALADAGGVEQNWAALSTANNRRRGERAESVASQRAVIASRPCRFRPPHGGPLLRARGIPRHRAGDDWNDLSTGNLNIGKTGRLSALWYERSTRIT